MKEGIGLFIKLYLLYKHEWNTWWAFARKHDIFTSKDNMLFRYGYIINRAFSH